MMIDFKLTATDGKLVYSLEAGDALVNNVLLSLFIKRGTFFVDPDFGSRLHEIRKVTDQSAALAKNYCEASLRWIVETGRAAEMAVTVERDAGDQNRMAIGVTVTRKNGEAVAVTAFYPVA